MASLALIAPPANVFQRAEDTYSNATGITVSIFMDSVGNLYLLVVGATGLPTWYSLVVP